MTQSKSKAPEAKAEPKPSATAKPGLKVKPVKDLEPRDSQSENVRGGVRPPGRIFSDVVLKSQVTSLRDALVKLRDLRF